MDFRIPREDPHEGEPFPGERILLGAVRLASLPFLLLGVLLAVVIYGGASLARMASMLAAGVRGRHGPGRDWAHPPRPRDA